MKAILRDTFDSTWRPQITAASVRRYVETDIGGRFVERCGADMLVAESDGGIAGLFRCAGDFVDALHVSSGFQRKGSASPGWKPTPSTSRAGASARRWAMSKRGAIGTRNGRAASPPSFSKRHSTVPDGQPEHFCSRMETFGVA